MKLHKNIYNGGDEPQNKKEKKQIWYVRSPEEKEKKKKSPDYVNK